MTTLPVLKESVRMYRALDTFRLRECAALNKHISTPYLPFIPQLLERHGVWLEMADNGICGQFHLADADKYKVFLKVFGADPHWGWRLVTVGGGDGKIKREHQRKWLLRIGQVEEKDFAMSHDHACVYTWLRSAKVATMYAMKFGFDQ